MRLLSDHCYRRKSWVICGVQMHSILVVFWCVQLPEFAFEPGHIAFVNVNKDVGFLTPFLDLK